MIDNIKNIYSKTKLTISKANLILISSFLLFIFLWSSSVYFFDIPKYILPPPSDVVKVVYDEKWLLLRHSSVTVFEAIFGLSLSVILAMAIGMMFHFFKNIQTILFPIVFITQVIPLIAIAPLIVIWFGFGLSSKIIVILIVCFFPILISILNGFNSVSKEHLDLMKTLKASNTKIFTKVLIPSSLPHLFAGLKISTTYSISAATISEWLGGKMGLGIYMTRTLSTYRIDALFAAILLVTIYSFILFKIINKLEKLSIPWIFDKKI